MQLTVPKDGFRVSGDLTFYTLQGEGDSIGKPAIFLRLHLCNLHCDWCDTRYTWDRELPEYWEESQVWSFEETYQKISRFNCKRLVISGGEPMLHAKQIEEFVKGYLDGWDVEIETNGTILPPKYLLERCQINCSPKLHNSGNSWRQAIRNKVLSQMAKYPNVWFKFVVQTPADLNEVGIVVKDCGLYESRVVIMPEGTTQERIAEHAVAVAEEVRNRGWRLLPRLHVMLWGQKRRT